ncbi:MAG: nucleotidyl transferase AbiEii/AbiGii toxin family protein [Candidatus Pacebacteria bacterium]|nr:nucleotidyl transferase AbiEii/AbiGii toxin family protein [Candidatus Paceibacterota bacterium]
MFYNILDKNRVAVLPLLKNFKKDFYLAGGTALALHLGHRDSIDFDFFRQKDIKTQELFERIKEVFKEHKILKIQDEHNTLAVIIDENIKLSFFSYKYNLIEDLIDEPNLKLASVAEIACMKLSAITGRAGNKDYIDLYYILQNMPLTDLLEKAAKKFPDLDRNLILKSLVYFDDLEMEPIMFKNNKEIDFETVKDFLKKKVFEDFGGKASQ